MGLFPRDPIWFAFNLVSRLRRSREAPTKPSTRQMIAIPRMILARFLRVGEVTEEDFVDIAVCTSPPENQYAAHLIALQLLNPFFKEGSKDKSGGYLQSLSGTGTLDQQDVEYDALNGILDELEFLKRFIGIEDSADGLDEELAGDESKYQELLDSIQADPYRSAAELLGGIESLLGMGINNREDLLSRARDEITKNFGTLAPEHVKAAQELNMLKDIAQKSPKVWERLVAEVLCSKDFRTQLAQEPLKFDEMLEAINLFRKSNLFSHEIREAAQESIKKMLQDKTLSDLVDVMRAFGGDIGVPEEVLLKIISHSIAADLPEALRAASILDQYFGTNLRNAIWDALAEEERPLSMEEIIKNPRRSPAWRNVLGNAVHDRLNQILPETNAKEGPRDGAAFTDLLRLAREITDASKGIHDFFCQNAAREQAWDVLNAGIDHTENQEQLEGLIQEMKDFNGEQSEIDDADDPSTSPTPTAIPPHIQNLLNRGNVPPQFQAMMTGQNYLSQTRNQRAPSNNAGGTQHDPEMSLSDPATQSQILKQGRKLGIPESDLLALLSPSYELLRSMIQEKIDDIPRFSSVSKMVSMKNHQIDQLVKDIMVAGGKTVKKQRKGKLKGKRGRAGSGGTADKGEEASTVGEGSSVDVEGTGLQNAIPRVGDAGDLATEDGTGVASSGAEGETAKGSKEQEEFTPNLDYLGNLASKNLGQVLKSAEQWGGDEGLDAALSSLTSTGAGPGEDLLMQWFLHRHDLPARVKDKVKQVLKDILIDIGIKYASAYLGSDTSGPLSETTVIPYTPGDDFWDIDIVETLEHILQTGKNVKYIGYEDFLIHKPSQGLRSIVIELDVSGSMSGARLTYCALCAVMLVYAFAPDELGLTLFESNTHVIKEIDVESVDLDHIADELLDIEAMGGTQMGAAVKWAADSFEKKVKSKIRINVLLTDAEIFDLENCKHDLERINTLGVKSIVVVPKFGFNPYMAREMADLTNGQVLTFEEWREFPKKISEILTEK